MRIMDHLKTGLLLEKYRTFFVDLDGVIFFNKGKYGEKTEHKKSIN